MLQPTLPLGSLTVGHLLLVASRHLFSIQEFEQPEKILLVEEVTRFLQIAKDLYGSVVLFEHGSPKDCGAPGGGCVEHAHLHIVPSAVKVSPFVKARLSTRDVSLYSFYGEEPNRPYLFVLDTDGESFAINESVTTSQYMRRVLWQLNDYGGHWDWRSDWRIDHLVTSRRHYLERLVNLP
jgi:hypothetical protein